ncbi:MAG: hypothetical protein WD887_02030 [Candidatus Saccharimonadales bacterium]
MRSPRRKSALVFVLKALLPYSKENLILSFRPNRFFNELEKTSGYSQKTLRETSRRAQHQGLIEIKEKNLRLTALGERTARPYIASRLKGGGKLMIIFDIPENRSGARQQLRALLIKWDFKQVQKSVWITDYDHRDSIKYAVRELHLEGCARLYECDLLYPSS